MENGFLVLKRIAFFCKASRHLKPAIVGHFLLAYNYTAFAKIVDSLSVCLSLMKKKLLCLIVLKLAKLVI
jgi:hypothetical protein